MNTSDWYQPLSEALEAARLEVLRRLREHQLPTGITEQRMRIVPGDSGRGSEWVPTIVSSLNDDEILMAIRDESIYRGALGLREQLEPLARELADQTDMGDRPVLFSSAVTGVEGILIRYLSILALSYLLQLETLEKPNDEIVRRLGEELTAFADAQSATHVRQVLLFGPAPEASFDYRDVSIRPLSNEERGIVMESRGGPDNIATRGYRMGIIVPHQFTHFMPSAVLEARHQLEWDDQVHVSTLLEQACLSFFLHGWTLSGLGVVTSYQWPIWTSSVFRSGEFPVQENFLAKEQTLSESDFHSVVDLAHSTPRFTSAEANSQEIALHRLLRACGTSSQESNFLDLAICLEAALLRDTSTELAYRFKLYGSLFLREVFDPEETFRKLYDIYSVRSKLVHGSPVKFDGLASASNDARILACAVIRRAIETGWPKAEELDHLARQTSR